MAPSTLNNGITGHQDAVHVEHLIVKCDRKITHKGIKDKTFYTQKKNKK